MQRRVLVGSIDTVWISVAQPPLGNALRPTPGLVLLARELRLIVTLPVIALMSVVLVTIVQAIIVSVANVNPWNTVSIVTREQVAEARSTLGLAILWRFISTIATVVVTVTVPGSRNTPMIRTPETVLRTRPLCTMQFILVGVVATVIVTITEPIRLNADVCLLALQVIRWTSGIRWTPFMRLI